MESRKFLLFSTFYPPYHLGGDATHVENLAKLLSKHGHEVHVVHLIDSYLFKKGKGAGLRSPERFIEDGITLHPLISPYGNLSLFKAYCLGNSSYYSSECQKIIDNVKPEIIHHHNISGFGPSILKFQSKYKKLYTAHDYWLICQNSRLQKPDGSLCSRIKNCGNCQIIDKRPLQIWRYGNCFYNHLSSIDCVITPSNYMKDKLVGSGISNRIEVISNFVSMPSRINPINKTEKHFLFVGLLDQHKGILELLSYYESIFDAFGIPLHIVGTGPLQKSVSNFIKEHHMEDKVRLLGKIGNDELQVEYQAALALILPSIWPENNPMVALEALSNGVPVIGKPHGGIPEIINPLDSRLLYNSIDQLIDSIGVIIDDPSFSEKSKKVFNDKFSETIFYKKYFDIINS